MQLEPGPGLAEKAGQSQIVQGPVPILGENSLGHDTVRDARVKTGRIVRGCNSIGMLWECNYFVALAQFTKESVGEPRVCIAFDLVPQQ